jgi:hypothetical protein
MGDEHGGRSIPLCRTPGAKKPRPKNEAPTFWEKKIGAAHQSMHPNTSNGWYWKKLVD